MKFYLIALAFICSAASFSAQNIEEPVSIRLLMEPSDEINTDDNQLDPFAAIDVGTPMVLKLMVGISSTLNLNEIEIKVGTSFGAVDVAEETFVFDNVFDNGVLSYERQDDQIILGIGEHPYSNQFYCEVFFKDAAGNSSAVKFYPEL